jgi:hypothetical protein
MAQQVRELGEATIPWSTGVRRTLPLGSRFFLMRLGEEPKGIVGAGTTITEPYEAPHWDAGKAANREHIRYVTLAFDSLYDPLHSAPFDPRTSEEPVVLGWHWTPQGSGIEIPNEVADGLEHEWEHYTGVSGAPLMLDPELMRLEGADRYRVVRHRTRERLLRKAKLAAASSAAGGVLRCEVPRCGFEFTEKYGDLGVGFAEVHHLQQLAVGGPRATGLGDLAVVCANCHRMIHRGGENRALEAIIPNPVPPPSAEPS